MNCAGCKERIYPQDPSKPYYVGFSTRFKGVSSLSGCLPPLCNGCSNYPGLWGEPESPVRMPLEPTARIDANTQLFGQVQYLQSKLFEHLDKSKKKGRYEKYTT